MAADGVCWPTVTCRHRGLFKYFSAFAILNKKIIVNYFKYKVYKITFIHFDLLSQTLPGLEQVSCAAQVTMASSGANVFLGKILCTVHISFLLVVA